MYHLPEKNKSGLRHSSLRFKYFNILGLLQMQYVHHTLQYTTVQYTILYKQRLSVMMLIKNVEVFFRPTCERAIKHRGIPPNLTRK